MNSFLKNCYNLASFDEIRSVLEKLLNSVCSVTARKIIQVKYELYEYLEDLIESSLH